MSGILGIFKKKNKVIGNPIDGIKDVVGEVNSLVDNLHTSDEEKAVLKNSLSTLIMSALAKVMFAQKELIATEMNGNFLQRSWRPIIMLTFAVIVIISVFTDTHLNEVPEDFWGLLKLGIGGYVGGRTIEKVAGTLTKNVDLSMLRKKDRKEFLENNR